MRCGCSNNTATSCNDPFAATRLMYRVPPAEPNVPAHRHRAFAG